MRTAFILITLFLFSLNANAYDFGWLLNGGSYLIPEAKISENTPSKQAVEYRQIEDFSKFPRSVFLKFYRAHSIDRGTEKQYAINFNPEQCAVMQNYQIQILQRLIRGSNLQGKANLNLLLTKVDCYTAFSGITGASLHFGYIKLLPAYFLHSDTEDELASVLAHELAHYLMKHSITLVAKYPPILKRKSRGSCSFLGGCQKSLPEGFSQFKRNNEIEAERMSFLLLNNAGYDFHQSQAFMQKIYSMNKGRSASKAHMDEATRKNVYKKFSEDYRHVLREYRARTIPREVQQAVIEYFRLFRNNKEKKVREKLPVKVLP